MDEKKIKYLRKSEELLKIKPEDIKTEEEAKKIIEELRDVINYHDYLYFVVNEPIITDYQYDQLFHLLEKLEERFPQFITPTSPTQRVASDITKEFPEVKHLSPMLSLENSYNEEDLREFDKRVREILNLDTVEYAV
ncbi:MAG: DNA ligase (NAD(+)) LigA, partial [Persephonella sp.]